MNDLAGRIATLERDLKLAMQAIGAMQVVARAHDETTGRCDALTIALVRFLADQPHSIARDAALALLQVAEEQSAAEAGEAYSRGFSQVVRELERAVQAATRRHED